MGVGVTHSTCGSQLLPLAKGRQHRNPAMQGHMPYTFCTHLAKLLFSHLHIATHTEPQYSHLPLGTARNISFNLPLWHTSQTPLRRQPPSPPGPRASSRIPYSCELSLPGESGALAGTQGAPRPGSFPFVGQAWWPVPLETDVCAVCRSCHTHSLSKRFPAARQVGGRLLGVPSCVWAERVGCEL